MKQRDRGGSRGISRVAPLVAALTLVVFLGIAGGTLPGGEAAGGTPGALSTADADAGGTRSIVVLSAAVAGLLGAHLLRRRTAAGGGAPGPRHRE